MSVLVLVVDDELDVADLFRQQFRRELRAGLFVMEFAYSAREALVRIMRPSDINLILLLSDINMPGMTGLELLPKVHEIRPDVPVVMITAYGDEDTRARALKAGAAGFLTKPIDFTLLREEITERLNSFKSSVSN
jgi:CheY-like chemotaxis protein